MKKILALSTACHKSVNREIYRILNKKGFELILLVPRQTYFNETLVSADPDNEKDLRIIFDEIDTRRPRIMNFKNIKKIITQEKPEIILIDNDPGSLMVLSCCFFSLMDGAKVYCLTCENLCINFISTLKRKGFKFFFHTFFTSLMLNLSKYFVDVVFTINNEGTENYKKFGFKKVKKIPLGFDTKLFHIDQKKREEMRIKLNTNEFLIGYLGRTVPEKGLDVLIEALSKIQSDRWSLMLDEFKDYSSDYQKKIHRLINEKNLKDKVIFVDPMHEEMGSFLNSLDILVVPSIEMSFWKEQYGRIAAEALACGIKVIYSNSGNLPSLIGKHGIFFEQGDFNQLSEIISLELNNNDIQVAEKEERSRYARNFLSAETQANEMIKMF